MTLNSKENLKPHQSTNIMQQQISNKPKTSLVKNEKNLETNCFGASDPCNRGGKRGKLVCTYLFLVILAGSLRSLTFPQTLRGPQSCLIIDLTGNPTSFL